MSRSKPFEGKTDPRRHLIHLFNVSYQNRTGKMNPIGFGTCMNAMIHFEVVDNKTGELFEEYPDEQSWQEQVNGYFKDEFAAQNCGFSFFYFLKQYGRFVKYSPKTQTRPITKSTSIMIHCDLCNHEHLSDGNCIDLPDETPEQIRQHINNLIGERHE